MRTLSLLCLLAGCLGEATFNNPDLSGNVVVDLQAPPPDLADKDALGDGGGLNCVMLNDCEKGCASDPKPVMCVADCRARASAAAVTKESALQDCFNQYCPQRTDAGTAAVCTGTDMGLPSACTMCISNSQVAPANMCNPTTAPECHQCNPQASACVADK